MSNPDWIVELQPSVRMWIAPWQGDPGRTCVESSARRFLTESAAKSALTRARRYSPFKLARIYQFEDKSVCTIPNSEPYDENNQKHQEPVQGISEWQDCNDFFGLESTIFELNREKDA